MGGGIRGRCPSATANKWENDTSGYISPMLAIASIGRIMDSEWVQFPPACYCKYCTSQQILDTNHKKIYNKKLSVSQISVRNATCDIELASDSLTNKLDAVH